MHWWQWTQPCTCLPFVFDKSKHQGQWPCAWEWSAGWLYFHFYSLYLWGMSSLLLPEFIISSLSFCKHWKEYTLAEISVSKLKALHGLVLVWALIKCDGNVWTCFQFLRFRIQMTGNHRHSMWWKWLKSCRSSQLYGALEWVSGHVNVLGDFHHSLCCLEMQGAAVSQNTLKTGCALPAQMIIGEYLAVQELDISRTAPWMLILDTTLFLKRQWWVSVEEGSYSRVPIQNYRTFSHMQILRLCTICFRSYSTS